MRMAGYLVVKIVVDGLPRSPNAIGRSHWTVQAKLKKEWADKIGWLARAVYKGNPLEKAHLKFTIYTGDNRRHDPDNLAWAVTKPTLDAIKGIIIVDDSIDHVTLEYEYSREKPRRFEVIVKEEKALLTDS